VQEAVRAFAPGIFRESPGSGVAGTGRRHGSGAHTAAPATTASAASPRLRADSMVSDGLLASAPGTLEETLAYLGASYGGALGYARAVGLGDAEVDAIRANLTRPDQAGAAGAPGAAAANGVPGAEHRAGGA